MGFQGKIIKWYGINKRDLPWRLTTDPYLIWLSEVILQQTRVDQGLPYYQRFTEKFPKVEDLATASLDAVLKLWEGLGYYSRARNLHTAAKYVGDQLDGKFPTDYKTLLKMKGVGPYTAAAIASFSAGKAVAVVDGNVYRVLSRYFGVDTPIDSPSGKKEFADLAASLIPPSNPGIYNQAIMEFGALQCRPAAPDCASCPLADTCIAFNKDLVSVLPVKSKKVKVTERHFNYLIISNKETILLKKRTESDIWRELFELPLIETKTAVNEVKLIQSPEFRKLTGANYHLKEVSRPITHKLSHQTINARFFTIEIKAGRSVKSNHPFIRVPFGKVREYPVPRLISRYFEEAFDW